LKAGFIFATNFFTRSVLPSSTETETTLRPFAAYFFCNWLR